MSEKTAIKVRCCQCQVQRNYAESKPIYNLKGHESGERVCDECRIENVEKTCKCPLKTCTKPSNRSAKFRTLPLKFYEVPDGEYKRGIIEHFGINRETKACCNVCYLKISKAAIAAKYLSNNDPQLDGSKSATSSTPPGSEKSSNLQNEVRAVTNFAEAYTGPRFRRKEGLVPFWLQPGGLKPPEATYRCESVNKSKQVKESSDSVPLNGPRVEEGGTDSMKYGQSPPLADGEGSPLNITENNSIGEDGNDLEIDLSADGSFEEIDIFKFDLSIGAEEEHVVTPDSHNGTLDTRDEEIICKMEVPDKDLAHSTEVDVLNNSSNDEDQGNAKGGNGNIPKCPVVNCKTSSAEVVMCDLPAAYLTLPRHEKEVLEELFGLDPNVKEVCLNCCQVVKSTISTDQCTYTMCQKCQKIVPEMSTVSSIVNDASYVECRNCFNGGSGDAMKEAFRDCMIRTKKKKDRNRDKVSNQKRASKDAYNESNAKDQSGTKRKSISNGVSNNTRIKVVSSGETSHVASRQIDSASGMHPKHIRIRTHEDSTSEIAGVKRSGSIVGECSEIKLGEMKGVGKCKIKRCQYAASEKHLCLYSYNHIWSYCRSVNSTEAVTANFGVFPSKQGACCRSCFYELRWYVAYLNNNVSKPSKGTKQGKEKMKRFSICEVGACKNKRDTVHSWLTSYDNLIDDCPAIVRKAVEKEYDLDPLGGFCCYCCLNAIKSRIATLTEKDHDSKMNSHLEKNVPILPKGVNLIPVSVQPIQVIPTVPSPTGMPTSSPCKTVTITTDISCLGGVAKNMASTLIREPSEDSSYPVVQSVFSVPKVSSSDSGKNPNHLGGQFSKFKMVPSTLPQNVKAFPFLIYSPVSQVPCIPKNRFILSSSKMPLVPSTCESVTVKNIAKSTEIPLLKSVSLANCSLVPRYTPVTEAIPKVSVNTTVVNSSHEAVPIDSIQPLQSSAVVTEIDNVQTDLSSPKTTQSIAASQETISVPSCLSPIHKVKSSIESMKPSSVLSVLSSTVMAISSTPPKKIASLSSDVSPVKLVTSSSKIVPAPPALSPLLAPIVSTSSNEGSLEPPPLLSSTLTIKCSSNETKAVPPVCSSGISSSSAISTEKNPVPPVMLSLLTAKSSTSDETSSANLPTSLPQARSLTLSKETSSVDCAMPPPFLAKTASLAMETSSGSLITPSPLIVDLATLPVETRVISSTVSMPVEEKSSALSEEMELPPLMSSVLEARCSTFSTETTVPSSQVELPPISLPIILRKPKCTNLPMETSVVPSSSTSKIAFQVERIPSSPSKARVLAPPIVSSVIVGKPSQLAKLSCCTLHNSSQNATPSKSALPSVLSSARGKKLLMSSKATNSAPPLNMWKEIIELSNNLTHAKDIDVAKTIAECAAGPASLLKEKMSVNLIKTIEKNLKSLVNLIQPPKSASSDDVIDLTSSSAPSPCVNEKVSVSRKSQLKDKSHSDVVDLVESNTSAGITSSSNFSLNSNGNCIEMQDSDDDFEVSSKNRFPSDNSRSPAKSLRSLPLSSSRPRTSSSNPVSTRVMMDKTCQTSISASSDSVDICTSTTLNKPYSELNDSKLKEAVQKEAKALYDTFIKRLDEISLGCGTKLLAEITHPKEVNMATRFERIVKDYGRLYRRTGRSDMKERLRLLSAVALNVPNSMLRRYFKRHSSKGLLLSVSEDEIKQAREHARQFGPGVPLVSADKVRAENTEKQSADVNAHPQPLSDHPSIDSDSDTAICIEKPSSATSPTNAVTNTLSIQSDSVASTASTVNSTVGNISLPSETISTSNMKPGQVMLSDISSISDGDASTECQDQITNDRIADDRIVSDRIANSTSDVEVTGSSVSSSKKRSLKGCQAGYDVKRKRRNFTVDEKKKLKEIYFRTANRSEEEIAKEMQDTLKLDLRTVVKWIRNRKSKRRKEKPLRRRKPRPREERSKSSRGTELNSQRTGEADVSNRVNVDFHHDLCSSGSEDLGSSLQPNSKDEESTDILPLSSSHSSSLTEKSQTSPSVENITIPSSCHTPNLSSGDAMKKTMAAVNKWKLKRNSSGLHSNSNAIIDGVSQHSSEINTEFPAKKTKLSALGSESIENGISGVSNDSSPQQTKISTSSIASLRDLCLSVINASYFSPGLINKVSQTRLDEESAGRSSSHQSEETACTETRVQSLRELCISLILSPDFTREIKLPFLDDPPLLTNYQNICGTPVRCPTDLLPDLIPSPTIKLHNGRT